MVGVQDSVQYGDDDYAPSLSSSNEETDWASAVEADLAGEAGRQNGMPLQHVLEAAVQESIVRNKPLRMALSAIRDNLDRRTREWRGSAKVVEQSLRQLVAAEQARAAALEELAEIEDAVSRTGQALTEALSSFDETDESKNIDPLFSRSDAALDELDRVTNDLSIAQHWCRSAWKTYSEALEREQLLRQHIQSADWAA